MATARTAIEWTEATWNPVTGCSKVSPGCAHCYAETLSRRFGWTGRPWTPANAEANVILRPERLDQPLRWRQPRVIFVNSMSDLFHELVPLDFIWDVFDVMAEARQHVFQILTKRHERVAELAPLIEWPENVWMGVSIENRRWVERADYLRRVPAAVRFVSAEPLLGPLDNLDLDGIDWTFENSCGVYPEPDLRLDDPQVFTGGTVSGNAACWEIRSSDAGSLAMFYQPFLVDQMTWFALR